ncbi:alpha/beta fold hydrolase [Candidatus Sumerlaeota bacterium]|nr:alpha/beta fold hydrolase [Candidatus Sumerlaeota bacterium]
MPQGALPPGDHLLHLRSAYDGSNQPYRLFIPSAIGKDKNLPLLIVLHGKGVDHEAWFKYTPVKEHAEKRGYIVAAPYGRGDYFYRGPGEQDVLDIIDTVKKQYPVDPDRVYLMGHSMGGWGTWWIALRHPDLFATICPMAAFTPFDLLPNALHLSPFIIHDKDDPIVPVEQSRKAEKELKRLNIPFRYKEEQGFGHSSKMIGANFPELFDWLDSHKRISQPDQVQYVTITPAKGDAYWVNILETIDYPALASVNATFKGNHHLSLISQNCKRLKIDLKSVPWDFAEPLKININQREFMVKDGLGEAVFLLEGVSKKWILSQNPSDLAFTHQSPVLTHISIQDDMITSPNLLTDAAARILCDVLNADVCLFFPDSFRFPGGPLTQDAVLDLYVYSEERLALFEYKGEALPMIIAQYPQIYPEGKYKPEEGKTWRCLAPLNIIEKMDIPHEILPLTIKEYLLKSLFN